MHVVPAINADAAEILALQKRAYALEAEVTGDYHMEPLTQSLESIRADFARMVVLKAVEDGRIVGSVRAHQDDGTVTIRRLIVEPELHGRGIGSELLRAIEDRFPTCERYELFTARQSPRNVRFYARRGYTELRDVPFNEYVTFVYFEKRR